MNVEVFDHDDWMKVRATNAAGHWSEMALFPGTPLFDYVRQHNRLNRSFIEYHLIEEANQENQAFLDFLLAANDDPSNRRLRSEGWQATAGLSTGEVPSKPKKPGDVVIHGNHARMNMTANSTRDDPEPAAKPSVLRRIWRR